MNAHPHDSWVWGVFHKAPQDSAHWVALDWAERTMALAHMTAEDLEPQVRESTADIVRLQQILKGLRGSIILTLEESNPAHWLY